MKTIYCNQYTDELFDTEEEAVASEKKYLEVQEARKRAEEERLATQKKKDSERAARAKHVEELLNKYTEARKEYVEALNAFCKDFGAFHTTLKGADPLDWFDLVADLFNH